VAFATTGGEQKRRTGRTTVESYVISGRKRTCADNIGALVKIDAMLFLTLLIEYLRMRLLFFCLAMLPLTTAQADHNALLPSPTILTAASLSLESDE
jgi:hypothetical protein